MTVTPNMGIYVPGEGEQNWGASFNAGLLNIDQHDHSGAPNKGLPIPGTGIADGSITPAKFASSVFGTGVEAEGGTGGPIAVAGVLKSFYSVGASNAGIVVVTVAGTTVAMRSLTGVSGQIDVTNPNGVAGNPLFGIARDSQLAPSSGDVTIFPAAGSVDIHAGDSAGFISFEIGAKSIGEMSQPANDVGARSLMFNLASSPDRVGINSQELNVTLLNGATQTFQANIFANQMWLFLATSTDGAAYCSYTYYGGSTNCLVANTTSPANTGCTYTIVGADLIFTNTSGSTLTFRLTGLRLY